MWQRHAHTTDRITHVTWTQKLVTKILKFLIKMVDSITHVQFQNTINHLE